jgi:beta-lactam-binding protein with PASTA domain
MRLKYRVLVAAGVLAACIVGVTLGLNQANSSHNVRVPSIVGLREQVAEAKLAGADLSFRIVHVARGPGHAPKPKTVISQTPAAGSIVSSGSKVTVNVYQ